MCHRSESFHEGVEEKDYASGDEEVGASKSEDRPISVHCMILVNIFCD